MEPGLEKLSLASQKVTSSRKAIWKKKILKSTIFECERKEYDITELLWFVLFVWLLNLLLSFKASRKQLLKEFERKERLKSGTISKIYICAVSLRPLKFF